MPWERGRVFQTQAGRAAGVFLEPSMRIAGQNEERPMTKRDAAAPRAAMRVTAASFILLFMMVTAWALWPAQALALEFKRIFQINGLYAGLSADRLIPDQHGLFIFADFQ